MKSPGEVANELLNLYRRFGDADYIGEPVSQWEHMSQAAQLAIAAGADDEIVLAAFFHDIGHICAMQGEANSMGGYGIKSHEKIGADYLRERGFPERLTRLVESHVQAKRYLTYTNPDYYNALSEASKKTLAYQGGPMNSDEAQAFLEDPLFEAYILLRRWDEQAKEEHLPILPWEEIEARIVNVLES